MFSKKITITLSLIFLYFVWGSTYLVIRYAIEEIPPLLMAGSRFIAASLPLFLLLAWRKAELPSGKQVFNASVIGVLMLAGGNGGVTFAEQWVASSLAAVVVATVPMWVAIWGGVFGRWPSRVEWFGLLLGFSGVVLLNLGGGLQGNLLGTIILLCAPISWALGSTLSQKLDLPKGIMAFAIEMLAGGLFLIFLSTLRGESTPVISSLSSVAVWAWLYLVLFGSLIAFSCYMFLLNETTHVVATSYAYVNPLVAVLLGVLIANETLTGYTVWGIGIIIVSVILLNVATLISKALQTHSPSRIGRFRFNAPAKSH